MKGGYRDKNKLPQSNNVNPKHSPRALYINKPANHSNVNCNTICNIPASSRRMSLDVSDDVTSCESLSFTTLVCIQNQHVTPQRGYTFSLTHSRKASQEFEFSTVTAASNTVVPRNKYSAETMFSNSHLEPHAKPFDSNQTTSVEQNSSKWIIPSAQSRNSRSDAAQTLGKPTRKANTEVRNRTDQNHTSGRQGFGQRIFKSFTTPCKDCRTIEPMQGKLQQKMQNDH